MHAPTRDIYTFPTRRSSDLPTFSGTCLLKGQGAAVNPTRIRTVARQLAGPPPRGAALTADADLLTRFLDRHDEARSEEHTSESSHQIISYAVFCLKKKTKKR